MEGLLEEPLFWKLALLLAAPACFYFGFRWWRRARLIEDTPLSRVRSAAQGYVELHGRGKLTEGSNIFAPLSHRPCVWWRYRIERKRETGKGTSWETITRGVSDLPFLLSDDSGWCVVNPQGADVYPSDQSSWYGSTARPVNTASVGGNYRYTEHRIYEQERIDVIGEFRTVGGVKLIDTEAEVAELLRDWKNDQPTLLKRFDSNRDGLLTQSEWEQASIAARREIEAHARQSVPQSYNVVMRPHDDRPFLIAAYDLDRLARRYRWRAAALLLAFVVISGALAAWSLG